MKRTKEIEKKNMITDYPELFSIDIVLFPRAAVLHDQRIIEIMPCIDVKEG